MPGKHRVPVGRDQGLGISTLPYLLLNKHYPINPEGRKQRKMTQPFNKTALQFIDKGIPVIPIAPQKKRPVNELGLKGASPDPDRVQYWMKKNQPQCNIAIPTGTPSGYLVVDIDMDKSKNGEAQWQDLLEVKGVSEPDTLEVRTPRGGRHIYFRMPIDKHIPSRTNHPRRNIDIRADGGYVLVPPSVVEGRAYTYARKAPIADCPNWLFELLKVPERKPLPPRQPWTGKTTEQSDIAYALGFIDSSDYFQWVKVGMAIYSEEPNEIGFRLFDDWSATGGEKYDHDACRAKWKSFGFAGIKSTLGSLFYLAKQGGWKPKQESEFDIRQRSGYFR